MALDLVSGAEATLSKYCYLPSENGYTLKGKNAPLGENSFLLERNPFKKELAVQENKQEISKVPPPLEKMAKTNNSLL